MSTSSSVSEQRRLMTLKASDGIIFLVEEPAAILLGTIKNMVDKAGCGMVRNGMIPIPNVDSKTLGLMLEWCKKHAEAAEECFGGGSEAKRKIAAELKEWDAKFVENMDQAILHDLLIAADYLEASDELITLLTKRVANILKGKTAERIRREFNIPNDFTPDEEERIRKRLSSWVSYAN
ncbi:S-phase kinase-associated protein [Trema orientale]|uniref:SKP1-like protein n=1 Tax=Trema orientale TaxID=63057 RepID=A0A2P5E9R4_TREOI|nr:S-phase kinase-associated protein [Trema orientale]